MGEHAPPRHRDVVEEDDRTARERIENLTFWGFLEAMVRVAQSKALPTNEQVEASECADGGEYLIRLKAEDPEGYREFCKAHDGEWWQPMRQPIADALQHMLMLVMRTVSDTLVRWEEQAKRRRATSGKPPSPPKPRSRSQSPNKMEPANVSADLIESMKDLGNGNTLSDECLRTLGNALDEQAQVHAKAATVINAAVRGKITREVMTEKKEACITMQAYARGQSARNDAGHQKQSIISIQAGVRGHRVRAAWKLLASVADAASFSHHLFARAITDAHAGLEAGMNSSPRQAPQADKFSEGLVRRKSRGKMSPTVQGLQPVKVLNPKRESMLVEVERSSTGQISASVSRELNRTPSPGELSKRPGGGLTRTVTAGLPMRSPSTPGEDDGERISGWKASGGRRALV